MKLELKHLAPYLPYDLKGYVFYTEEDFELISLYTKDDINNKVSINSWLTGYACKPILRPLSDTSKEIEVNGEKFIPYIKLLEQNNFDVKNMNKSDLYGYKDFFKDPDLLMYNDVLKMIEWHFDIFSLIENDLAIDINTL